MFKAHPEIQKEFKAFVGRDPDSLKKNPRLVAHASTVMSAVSNVVDNLNDPATLVEILKTTAVNHRIRGVKKEYFEVSHSSRLHCEIKNIWNIFIKFAFILFIVL